MKAIILAAGRGSRMGDETKEKPKCLTQLNGKPLIQYQIDALNQAGIKDVAVVTGYKGELLRHYGTQHFANTKWSETNMVASLLCAQSWLDQYDCIISYSDIFYQAQIVSDLITQSHPFVIAYDPNWFELWSKRFENPLLDAESFSLDSEHFLIHIGKKNVNLDEINGQYMGLLKIDRGLFTQYIQQLTIDFNKIDMTSLLSLIINKEKILCVPNTQRWGEVDSVSDLDIYTRDPLN